MPLVRKKSGHWGTAGFTLVELGVVIAMTGVLTALLLPALSTAKEKSRRAVCQSNLRQNFVGLLNYASESEDGDTLPNPADNKGQYHSIELSDKTFSDFVMNELGGNANVLYCPNFDYGKTPLTNAYGHIIGYNYLAGYVQTTLKGPEEWALPQKLLASSPTNKLMADANYWTVTPGSASIAIAPHTPSGGSTMAAAMTARPMASPVTPAPPQQTSISLGAAGGNVCFMDGSVLWKSITSMSVHTAASDESALGAW
jgi:hypothetical protein